MRIASPGYFDVMRLRLRSGRLFTRLDGAGSPRVVVVNETFAREIFGGEPAVGQRLLFAGGASSEPWEVVGVVADIQYQGLTVAESDAEAYISVSTSSRHRRYSASLSRSSPCGPPAIRSRCSPSCVRR